MQTTLETPKKIVDLLMVDDNPTDTFFMQLALRRSHRPIRTKVATNGDEAMSYLRDCERKMILPDLILLDLSLPGKNGWEVLREVKKDPVLGKIPVVVVSGSNNVRDVLHAREMESDFYLVKPMEMMDFPKLVKVVDWILKGTVKGEETEDD